MPLNALAIAFVGAIVVILVLSRVLPKTSLYPALVSQGASGVQSDAVLTATHHQRLGWEGIALSPLRPGGKAKFGEEILDVVSEGDLIEKGRKVRIIGNSGHEAVVEAV